MEKKMIKQMMMALLLAMMPFAASAQEISIGGSWANEPAKLGKNKTLDTSVMECIYNVSGSAFIPCIIQKKQ